MIKAYTSTLVFIKREFKFSGLVLLCRLEVKLKLLERRFVVQSSVKSWVSVLILAKMRSSYALLLTCLVLASTIEARRKLKREERFESSEDADIDADADYEDVEPCQCGVFMSQQIGIKPGRRSRPRGPPQGEPVVTYDTDEPSLPCGGGGNKHCISKCLDVILKYLPKAGPVICGAVERDVHREKAFLFIRNCGGEWFPTSFSAGKEFCCTDGQHHKC